MSEELDLAREVQSLREFLHSVIAVGNEKVAEVESLRQQLGEAERTLVELKPNPNGYQAARRLAGWELGDASWADRIIWAYLHPAEANAMLDEDDVPCP